MKNKSILPVRLVGLMLLDEEGAPLPNALTSITYSAQGVEVERDERRDQKKILDRLKNAIGRLEKEQTDVSIR